MCRLPPLPLRHDPLQKTMKLGRLRFLPSSLTIIRCALLTLGWISGAVASGSPASSVWSGSVLVLAVWSMVTICTWTPRR